MKRRRNRRGGNKHHNKETSRILAKMKYAEHFKFSFYTILVLPYQVGDKIVTILKIMFKFLSIGGLVLALISFFINKPIMFDIGIWMVYIGIASGVLILAMNVICWIVWKIMEAGRDIKATFKR